MQAHTLKNFRARAHYGSDHVKFKTDRRARGISDRSIREAVRHRSIRKAAPISFFAAPHAEILEQIGEYKQRDATVRTRDFDGAGR